MKRTWQMSFALSMAMCLGPLGCGKAPAGPEKAQKPADAPAAPSAQVAAPKAEATGPAAPELRLSGWVGTAPALSARPRLVAAWATWCPGCRAETAFLTALGKKYAGKVDVFALSDETADKVTSFAKTLGAPIRLEFPVALSSKGADDKAVTLDAFYGAVGMRFGIMPHAFLIAANKIVWHGKAGDASAALDEVLATGDAARARSAESELEALQQRYLADYAAGGREKARSSAKELFEAARGHADFLNSMAWDMVESDGEVDLAFALELARAGVEASAESEFTHLDTLGLALWKNGKKAEALAVQKKAIALCDALGGGCPEEKERLKRFEGG